MKNNYICNCEHYDFSNKDFKYWENRAVTTDEISIVEYIKSINYTKRLNILHVGVGNSYVYEQLNYKHKLCGITIANSEITKSNLYNDKNYDVFYCDKMSKSLQKLFHNKKFDLIIDSNLKSYSCCNKTFNYMFNNFVNLLELNGSIITTRVGMNWVKKLKPSISFNFKEFLHYKLKEYDGDQINIFTIEEAQRLSKNYSLELNLGEKIVSFKK